MCQKIDYNGTISSPKFVTFQILYKFEEEEEEESELWENGKDKQKKMKAAYKEFLKKKRDKEKNSPSN